MKVISISMVRNEEDILEAFVRYHTAIMDRMIFIDHRSMDRSLEILGRLKSEGLPIEIRTVQDAAYEQSEILTTAMHEVASLHNPEWILPLDADEFLMTQSPEDIRTIISSLRQEKVASLSWKTYVPTPDDDLSEVNPFKRIQHRRVDADETFHKVLIPRPFTHDANCHISQGSHCLYYGKWEERNLCPFQEVNNLWLAHFPIRSAQQVTQKALIGWPSNVARPHREAGDAFHWKQLFDRCKNGKPISQIELQQITLGYSREGNEDTQLIHDPVPTEGLLDDESMFLAPERPQHEMLRMLAETGESLSLQLAAKERANEQLHHTLRKTIDEYQQEREQLQKKIHDLESHNVTLKAAEHTARTQQVELLTTLEDLENVALSTTNAQLSLQRHAIEREKELHQCIHDLETEMEKQVIRIEEKKHAMAQTISEQQKELRALREWIVQEQKDMEQHIEEIRGKWIRTEKELASAVDREKELHAVISQYHEEKAGMTEQLRHQSVRASKLASVLSQVKGSLQESSRSLEETRDMLRKTKSSLLHAEKKSKETQQQRESLQSELTSTRKELQATKGQLEYARDVLHRMERTKTWRWLAPLRFAQARLRETRARVAKFFFEGVRRLKQKDIHGIKRIAKIAGGQRWPGDITEQYQNYVLKTALTAERYQQSIDAANRLAISPLISIVVPLYKSPEIYLRKALNSVVQQTYPHWELVIINDGSQMPKLDQIVGEYEKYYGEKVRYINLEENVGISESSNRGMNEATGDYIAFLDHDDELQLDALEKIVSAIARSPTKPDCIYTDHDKINKIGKRYDPAFKPDWSPETLLSYNYIIHFKVFSREILQKVGGLRKEYDTAQDYDHLLRVAEQAETVLHVPKVLYHWRSLPGSVASCALDKPSCIENGRRALQEAIRRRGMLHEARILPLAERKNLGLYTFGFNIPDCPKVTIIIPTKDRVDLLKPCIRSLQRKTAYPNVEILIVDNGSQERKTHRFLRQCGERVVRIDTDSFNYSFINNRAVESAQSELILFLNNDTEIINPEWLHEMVGALLLDDRIGAVGAKLLFPDTRVQHGGVVLGMMTTAGHANRLLPKDELGYYYSNQVLRNYSAVTAACMLTKKSLFQEVGGFDEENLPVQFNDVDFCLKIQEKGYRTLWTPKALLMHYESASRQTYQNDEEAQFFCAKWSGILQKDPYHHPDLSLTEERIIPQLS